MNRQIEQTLLSLLPTHNAQLPRELIELAGSLHAQSRNRATLKVDEEVARVYACAHLACERLKISLNLPPIEERPPIPPQIYKRLYNHLEKILPASTPGRANFGRSGARSRDLGSSPSGRSLPSRGTPSKEDSLASFRNTPGSKSRVPSKLNQATASASARSGKDALPPWIQPSLRFLCKELKSPSIGPVIMAGMQSIVMPQGKRTENEWANNNLPSLLGALFLYVWRAVEMSADIEQARYLQARVDIADVLKRARNSVAIKGVNEEAAWDSWRDIGAKDVDTAMLRISKEGWQDGDWAQAIDDLIDAKDRQLDGEEGPAHRADEDEDSHQGFKKGDSMFQDRYDYLSEKKQREYAAWKKAMLARIKALERDGGDAMELDS